MSDHSSNDTIAFDLPKNQSSVIKVIGVGGGGSNAVNHMFGAGIRGVDFVVCNTDAQALQNSAVPNKIQLGVTLTEGLGAGANPEVGQRAAEENIDEIKSLLETNTKMVFITAGMGGGTGTGAAPVIAKAATELGILTVGICTIPFSFEGNTRKQQAQKGVEALRANVDSLVVINNNKLREVYGNLSFKSGFAKADEVLATAARGIAEVITHHYTTNIDLRDAKTVLASSGTAIMGSASASGAQRASEAISQALDSPLLNDNHIRGAKNVLLLIVSGKEEITIDEIGEINDYIQNEAGGSANIIMGIGEDPELSDDIAVTVVATGFAADQQVQVIGQEPQKVVHTLEDEQELTNTVFQQPLKSEEDQNDELIDNELAKAEAKIKSSRDSQPNLFDNSEESEPETPDSAQPQASYPEELPLKPEEESHPETENQEDSEPVFEIDEPQQPEEETDNPAPQQVFSLEEDSEEGKNTDDTPAENRSEQEEAEERSAQENQDGEAAETPRSSDDRDQTIRYTLEDYNQLENQLRNARPDKPTDQSSDKKQQPVKVKDQKAGDEDESLRFEIKEVQQPAARYNPQESPMEQSIEESMQMKAEERRAKLKAFNYRFKNHPFSVDETDHEPAYKRQGVKLEETRYSRESRASRFSIEDSEDGSDIKTNNSFLHDNVD